MNEYILITSIFFLQNGIVDCVGTEAECLADDCTVAFDATTGAYIEIHFVYIRVVSLMSISVALTNIYISFV